jgi:hypothetical protein
MKFWFFHLFCLNEVQSFKLKGCMVWEIQKKELFNRVKKASADLDGPIKIPDRGVHLSARSENLSRRVVTEYISTEHDACAFK